MPLVFRTATEDDLDRILDVHMAAFPDDRSAVERRRSFTANVHGGLEDLTVAVEDGEIVGQAFLFPMELWFGGRPVPVGGIASLAVAPGARGHGIATKLLAHLHVESDVRGDALTMLYAFRQSFYARLGYGTTTSRRRLAIDPASIPAAWRSLARARVRGARTGDREEICAAYARAAEKRSGWSTRGEAFWDRHLARERRQFLVAGRDAGASGVSGYVAFELAHEEQHAATTLTVHELVADDDSTRLALMGALGAMRAQAAEIEIEVDATDPIELALVDSDGRRFGTDVVEHDLGTIVGGPMVRIEDVSRAIEARGYAADGSFDVIVRPHPGETNGAHGEDEIAVAVEVAGGRATVSPPRAASSALRTSRAALASMLYGGLSASDAVKLGLADADPRTLARIDPVLAMPPVAPIDPF
jgi:predicted acetyltransferase